MAALLLLCMIPLVGCDPVIPLDNIEAIYSPKPLTQGTTAQIEITYPETDGTAVVKWTDQKVEIINGGDIVDVYGLSITGLKPGRALLRVEVKANCSFMGVIIDKPVFYADIDVEVE